VRLAVISRLRWIRRHRERFEAQPRETKREMVSARVTTRLVDAIDFGSSLKDSYDSADQKEVHSVNFTFNRQHAARTRASADTLVPDPSFASEFRSCWKSGSHGSTSTRRHGASDG